MMRKLIARNKLKSEAPGTTGVTVIPTASRRRRTRVGILRCLCLAIGSGTLFIAVATRFVSLRIHRDQTMVLLRPPEALSSSASAAAASPSAKPGAHKQRGHSQPPSMPSEQRQHQGDSPITTPAETLQRRARRKDGNGKTAPPLLLSPSVLPLPSQQHSAPRLRLDWTRVAPLSPIAQQLWDLQHNCSLPYKKYAWRDGHSGGYGIGSDLHAWGNALWAGLHDSHRISSHSSPWIWTDREACGTINNNKSSRSSSSSSSNSLSLHCYLSHSIEPSCGPNQKQNKARIHAGPCGRYIQWSDNASIPEFRAAATEFAFSSVSPIVVQEAQRQLRHVFSGNSTPAAGAIMPPSTNLITVHVRWGDKSLEGSRKNQAIQEYLNAIDSIVRDAEIEGEVHILLCTEDPEALKAFEAAVVAAIAAGDEQKERWHIHVDHFYTEYLPYRKDREVVYNVPSHIAIETKGRAGLWAMGSLLVAMQSNYYVLTTKSNWSRLMNELRKNVIHPRCNNCTRMIDLEYGEC